MNGADHQDAGLRAAVRAAIAADDLEDTLRAVLEARFPAEEPGASLDEAGAALGMSPALVAHIEFAALCAIAAGRSHHGAAIQTTSGPGRVARPLTRGKGRSMTTSDTTTTTLAVLPIDAITVRDGWNPRTADDKAEREQLTESIRAQGILQPLLVERTDDGPVLIDGHRRLAAARAAGLTEVPVIERAATDGDAPQLAAALAANMRRRGLDPIEEARAYERATRAGWPQRRIAEAVGCSPRHVSQRLRLLRLPDVVQEAIGAGALPLSAVPTVETIAAVAPTVADAVAAALRTGALSATELTEHPEGALCELAQPGDHGQRPTLVALPGYQDLAAMALDADLAARAAAAGVHGVSFSAEDMDAARAFGCLIEFAAGEDRYWRRGFVADAPWLADRVALHIERAGSARVKTPSVARRHAPQVARRARATRIARANPTRSAAAAGVRRPPRTGAPRAWRTSTSGGGRFSPTTSRPRSRCRWRARSCWSPSTTAPRTPLRGFASPTSGCSAPRRRPPRRGRRASGSATPSATRRRWRSWIGSMRHARRRSLSAARCRRSSAPSTPIRRPCRTPSDGPPSCRAATAAGSRRGSRRGRTRAGGAPGAPGSAAARIHRRRRARRVGRHTDRDRRGATRGCGAAVTRPGLRSAPRWPERPPGSLRPGALRSSARSQAHDNDEEDLAHESSRRPSGLARPGLLRPTSLPTDPL